MWQMSIDATTLLSRLPALTHVIAWKQYKQYSRDAMPDIHFLRNAYYMYRNSQLRPRRWQPCFCRWQGFCLEYTVSIPHFSIQRKSSSFNNSMLKNNVRQGFEPVTKWVKIGISWEHLAITVIYTDACVFLKAVYIIESWLTAKHIFLREAYCIHLTSQARAKRRSPCICKRNAFVRSTLSKNNKWIPKTPIFCSIVICLYIR